MLLTNRLTPRLQEILLQHLQGEEELLLRMQEFAGTINRTGLQTLSSPEQQTGFSAFMEDLFALQLQRQALCGAIARCWNCEPGTVRLSQVQLDSALAMEQLQHLRRRLMFLAHQTQASLQAAESMLKGWSNIINLVMGELLGTNATTGRYAANGQRVASTRIGSLDVRT